MVTSASIVNRERALAIIADIVNMNLRESLQLIVDGVERFYIENPGELKSPFDIGFFVEVLREVIADIRALLDGSQPVRYLFDDYPELIEVNPESDVRKTGIRGGQAYNYAAGQNDRRIQAVLLNVHTRADMRQRRPPKGRSEPLAIHPLYPFDFLFAVKALDYALQPGGPARLLLEGKSEPS